jgi:hypothetical protein
MMSMQKEKKEMGENPLFFFLFFFFFLLDAQTKKRE